MADIAARRLPEISALQECCSTNPHCIKEQSSAGALLAGGRRPTEVIHTLSAPSASSFIMQPSATAEAESLPYLQERQSTKEPRRLPLTATSGSRLMNAMAEEGRFRRPRVWCLSSTA
uniref:Uncharacterized protein n=1 Tax=Alexandrium monilatum TaxID=311494 RepID=A0A7S4S4B0_9DINO